MDLVILLFFFYIKRLFLNYFCIGDITNIVSLNFENFTD
jgi:hypothetical protein